MNPETGQSAPLHDQQASEPIESLQAELDRLVQKWADQVDRPGLVLVEAMIRRYQQNPSRFLLSRIRQRLESLSGALSQREASSFGENSKSPNTRAPTPAVRLQKLREQVERGEVTNPAYSGNLSFDDFLMSQEQEILATVSSENNIDADSEPQAAGEGAFNELRSIKHFRESWVKLNSERLLAQAIADTPKDAGPLNSHRLAIKSLTAMRDLSPEYLNRFLSYLETLLWLEKAGESIGLNPRARSRKNNSSR